LSGKESSSSPHLVADGILLGVSVFWGTSFAIVKEALEVASPANFLFIRFSMACLILLPAAWARRRSWSKQLLWPGALVGFFLFGAFFTQAWGLVYTSASRSGFITGLSVILVPLFSIILLRQMPGWSAMLGAGLAFFGLYLLASGDQAQGLPFNLGDMLTLVCAVFWASHILALGRYSPGADTFWLTFIQLLTAGIGSFTGAGLSGTLSLALPGKVYGAALYLAIACTILAYLGQTWAQARTTPTRTAIILTMEPVFAALFAWWWLGERLGLWGWIGAGLILGGILSAELKPNGALRPAPPAQIKGRVIKRRVLHP
jgi:drug/metabolite transporter (DMT)-like permease